MTTSSLESYVEKVRLSGLVDDRRLGRVLQGLSDKRGTIDCEVLRQTLLDQQLLTPWQDVKLREGRHHGFFIGKYKLLDHLGTGGMGAVYLAEHINMRRRVAIKVLPKKLVREDAEYLERFHREARAIAALDHPNIVRAFDVGCDNGTHYLTLEHIEGASLELIVEERGPIAFGEAADYLRQAAAGLDHAHNKGIIHRDIKPANLLVDADGRVKILDMGLAKLTEQDDRNLTELGQQVLGTAEYMAPEQALNSAACDERADLYALGATFYFLCTGKPPFTGKTLASLLVRQQNEDPKSLVDYRPDAPQPLVDLCQRLLAKSPEQRIQTAAELQQMLAQRLAQTTDGAKARPGDSTAAPAPPEQVVATDEPTDEFETAATPVVTLEDDEARNSFRTACWIGGIGITALALLTVVIARTWLVKPSEPTAEVPQKRSFVDPSVTWDSGVTAKPKKKSVAPKRPPPAPKAKNKSSPKGTNVALTGTATQSSTYRRAGAAKAIDGNTDGRRLTTGSVTHTENERDSWWEVDLGKKIHDLHEIVLFNRTDGFQNRLSNLRVSVLDGKRVVFKKDCYSKGHAPASFRIALPPSTSGNRVRVELRGLNNRGDGCLSLAEVQVWTADRSKTKK